MSPQTAKYYRVIGLLIFLVITTPVSFLDNDKGAFDFMALREIKEGDELAWDYECSDYEISTPFQCTCGSRKCRGVLWGFKYNNDVITFYNMNIINGIPPNIPTHNKFRNPRRPLPIPPQPQCNQHLHNTNSQYSWTRCSQSFVHIQTILSCKPPPNQNADGRNVSGGRGCYCTAEGAG